MAAELVRRVVPAVVLAAILLGSAAFVAANWNPPPPPPYSVSFGPPVARVPGSPYGYSFADWSIPLCGPGALDDDRGVNFAYYYAGCSNGAARALVINGTEADGGTVTLTFTDLPVPNPTFVTVLSPDEMFGFQWELGSPEVRLLVAFGYTESIAGAAPAIAV
jgi:hypothetical protein